MVRCEIAGDPNTPPDLLAILAEDDDYEVYLTVLNNPSLPLESLIKISERLAD